MRIVEPASPKPRAGVIVPELDPCQPRAAIEPEQVVQFSRVL